MLSYQHGYHAGGRADVLKHAVLHAVLTAAARRTGDILYVETHSGRGAYDLDSPEAKKTGEAAAGVRAVQAASPAPLQPWLRLIETAGPRAYPGSPVLAATTLAGRARFVFFERHPAEYDALAVRFSSRPDTQLKQSDGYAGALRLAPRRNERLIVFVDPSYETERDIHQLADWAPRARRRWPDALLIFWIPLFEDGREQELGARLTELGPSFVAGAHWPAFDGSALSGSAVLAVNPPRGAAQDALAIAESLTELWAA